MRLFFTVLRSIIASRLLWWAMAVAPEDEKNAYLIFGREILAEAVKASKRSYCGGLAGRPE